MFLVKPMGAFKIINVYEKKANGDMTKVALGSINTIGYLHSNPNPSKVLCQAFGKNACDRDKHRVSSSIYR